MSSQIWQFSVVINFHCYRFDGNFSQRAPLNEEILSGAAREYYGKAFVVVLAFKGVNTGPAGCKHKST